MESKVKQGERSLGQYILYRAAQGRVRQARAEQRKGELGRKLADASSALLCFP